MRDGAQELIEEMGMFFNSSGLPRAAGRIFGFLMTCRPPEQSAAEISAAIGMSLGSISSNARLLQQHSIIEQRSRPGDRRILYRLRDDVWMEMTRNSLHSLTDLALIAQRAEAAGGVPRTDTLHEMAAFAEFMDGQLPEIAARWEAVRPARSKA